MSASEVCGTRQSRRVTRQAGTKRFCSRRCLVHDMPHRCADIILGVKDSGEGSSWTDVRLGSFGMLHPEVLKAFELRDPSSAVEMDLEPLL